MIYIFLIAGIAAGFAFPAFLIKAIRAKDDEVWKPTMLACLTFGVCVMSILVCAANPYV